jgi:prepilin-type N-terminal cleavage/methylation domain-containing protein
MSSGTKEYVNWATRFATSGQPLGGRLKRECSRGFTLVEVLVALVVTSLLISILVGMLYYMFRVQDSLQGEVVIREAQLRAKAWFSDTLANCLSVEKGAGVQFEGTKLQIVCETTAALSPRSGNAPTVVYLRLDRNPLGSLALSYSESKQEEPHAVSHVLAEWSGGEGGFVYVDAKDQESDRWPTDKSDSETLPKLVRMSVKRSDDPPVEWVVAMRNTPWLEELPKNPFGLGVFK